MFGRLKWGRAIKFRLQLVGPFGLYTPDQRRIPINSQKGMALIAFVALGPHGVRARRKLEATFWGEREDKQAKDSLRRELSNCRKALRSFGAGALLESDMQRVSLDLEIVEVDVLALGGGAARSGFVPLPRGELLEGLDLRDCEAFEDWLRAERERVEAAFDDAIEAVASVSSGPGPAQLPLSDAQPMALPPKPTLAVLPFTMMGSPGEEWRGVAIAEALALILSEFPQVLVKSHDAATGSAQAHGNRVTIANDVGARYLVEGTCFPHADGRRAIVKIVEGQTGEQIWTREFVFGPGESIPLERAIATAAAPQIWTGIDLNERRRFLRRASPVLSNYEKYWKANALFRSWRKDDVDTAAQMAAELVEHAPACPWATSLAALTHALGYVLGALPDDARMRSTGYCETALRVGEDNVETLGYCAGAMLLVGEDADRAGSIVDSALYILPDHQPSLFWGGWADLLRGEAVRAVERFEAALQINPVSGARGQMLCGIGFGRMMQGQYTAAAEALAQARMIAPEFPLVALGTSLARGDDSDDARAPITAQFLRSAIENLPAILRAEV